MKEGHLFISGLVKNEKMQLIQLCKKRPWRNNVHEISFTVIYKRNDKKQYTKLSIPGIQGQNTAIAIQCIFHFMF